MDPRLVKWYSAELKHLREMGAEFARQFPKIAARLGIDGLEVSDPYVERLLEGAAFLNARVQLRLDAEFPQFTQRLLDIVYPQMLAPIPSMAMAQFEVDLNDPALDQGFTVDRGAGLRGLLSKGESTACQFETAHAVELAPLTISEAEYFTYASDLPLTRLPCSKQIKGGVRIRLKTRDGLPLKNVAIDRLPIYLSGSEDTAFRLYELIHRSGLGVLGVADARPSPWQAWLPATQIQPLGFDDDEALLPQAHRGFSGYRLLQEYFAFPQRYLFVEIGGLSKLLQHCDGSSMDVVLPLSKGDASLEGVVDAANFKLFCTPVINLFSKRTDRIHVTDSTHNFHVVVDRTRPMDFEVHSVASVTGYDEGNQNIRTFKPFYDAHPEAADDAQAYFSVQREPRLLSSTQQKKGARSSYVGGEAFLSLVDAAEAPYSQALKQLAVTALCTNRDLPLQMPLGVGKTDFQPEQSLPVSAVRCVKGPTRPRASLSEQGSPWALISHLSLNYLSLMNDSAEQGASALRQMLSLYGGKDAGIEKQIESVRSVAVRTVTRRLPMPGPIAFGRGLEIELEVNELGFHGSSAYLFGTVMERFFARYAALNVFTETVLRTSAHGDLVRWRPRCGARAIL